jgi:predicted HicB family RNase H-like nuclease
MKFKYLSTGFIILNPELHKKAAFIALQKNISLNKYVEIAIERAVELESQHGILSLRG